MVYYKYTNSFSCLACREQIIKDKSILYVAALPIPLDENENPFGTQIKKMLIFVVHLSQLRKENP